MVVLDDRGVIVAVNEAWRSATAEHGLHPSAAGVGAAYFGLAKRFVPEIEEERFNRTLEAMRAGLEREVRYFYAIQTPKGPRWRQVQLIPLRLRDELQFIAIHEDVTELMKAQEALRQASEDLVRVREDERRRIALELHDSTSQHLAVLGLGLARLRKLVDSPAGLAVLDEMHAALSEAVRETRVISYLMNPAGLLQEGLDTTARRFAEGLAARTGLAVQYLPTGPVDEAPLPVQHAALRVVQEALANVYRHAGAQNATVVLESAHGALKVSITDDGCGFPAPGPKGEPPPGVGILGMRARVEQLGGRFEITGSSDGCRVRATLPLR